MELRSRSPQGYDFSELKSNLNAINNYKTALSKGLGYWFLNEKILFINTEAWQESEHVSRQNPK